MARILLVEDQLVTARIVETILITAAHQVVWCRDGRAGLAAFTEAPPDVVITDILMPELDGIALIGAIRSMGFATPIVALSGGGPAQRYGYLDVARQVGADHAIRKPVSREELLSVVDHCLEISGPRPDKH
jgi:CheY-like chemotaxis protein